MTGGAGRSTEPLFEWGKNGTRKKRITCVLLMYTRSTQTPTDVLSAQAHWHTLVPKVPNPLLEGGLDRFPTLTGDTRGQQKTEHNLRIKIRRLNTHFYLAKTESPPETEETVSSELRGTYTITIFLQSAWVPVCALRDVATFLTFLNQTSNTQAFRHSHEDGGHIQRLAHVHAKHQFDLWRQNWGRKMTNVCKQMNAQMGSWTAFKNTPGLLILPPSPLCVTFSVAAPEESPWSMDPAAQSVSRMSGGCSFSSSKRRSLRSSSSPAPPTAPCSSQ